METLDSQQESWFTSKILDSIRRTRCARHMKKINLLAHALPEQASLPKGLEIKNNKDEISVEIVREGRHWVSDAPLIHRKTIFGRDQQGTITAVTQEAQTVNEYGIVQGFSPAVYRHEASEGIIDLGVLKSAVADLELAGLYLAVESES